METVQSAARLAHVHPSTLYRWIKRGKVKAWRPHLRYTLVDLVEVYRVVRGERQ